MQTVNLDATKPILEKYGVEYAGIFGSFARGDANQDSDIDILISLKEPIGLFSLAELQRQLSKILDRKVDLVTKGGLSPHMRDAVLHSTKQFYGAR